MSVLQRNKSMLTSQDREQFDKYFNRTAFTGVITFLGIFVPFILHRQLRDKPTGEKMKVLRIALLG